MSDPSPAAPASSPETPPATAPTAGSSHRRKTIQFIVLFVVYVLALLLGYRFAVNTEANMWYLFQTARHTSAVLSLIGESAVEQVAPGEDTSWMRERLEEWRGKRNVADAENGAPPEPLSAYERWLYKAYQTLRTGATLDNTGPQVNFVAEPGLRTKMDLARKELYTLQRSKAGETEIAAAKQKVQDLSAEHKALPIGPEGTHLLEDKGFVFVVVPDCGAIEVIAIYIAAVLAFPTLFRRRFLGLLVGIPVLYGVNLIRLSSLAYLASYDPTPGLKWFHFGHEFVWQAVFIIFVVAVWLCWIEFVVQRKSS